MRRRSSALWGALLIFIGLAWIAGSTNLVQIDIIGAALTLWPIFIIAAGITFFLKHDSHIQRAILWILVFAIIGGYGIYLGYTSVGGTQQHKTFEMKSGIQSATLQVNVGGSRFDIGSDSQNLAAVDANVKGLRYEYFDGSNPKITYSQNVRFGFGFGGRQTFNARLNNPIPWNVELNTGATNGVLDFSDVALKNCTINTGATELDMRFGTKQQDSRVTINGGVVNLKLNVPSDAGLKISSSSAVTKVNGSIEMLKDGNVYTSGNYDQAPAKVWVDISSGASNITVNR
ncbi:MAG: hypothetical protein N2376_00050 [Clostridia bacterium]|nr:hypothetical protein [Clostridia bacterium]